MIRQSLLEKFTAVKWSDVTYLLLFSASFLSLLNFYGYALLPFFPDESLFLQPAKNLVEGKGMGTPALDDLLPGISERTYWQPPVYFLTLATWGKLFGFDIISSRWLSRFCAVGIFWLLWLLARQWGINRWLALVCVTWVGFDLTFQYNANLGRMDTLNAFWLIASLLAFTLYEQNGKEWQVGLSGFFGTLAILTHFIAIPTVLTLGLILIWRRQGKSLVWFSLPILAGWVLWLAYAAQDWQGWIGQMELQFARKGEGGLSQVLIRMLFLQSFLPLYGVFPINSPPIWLALVALSTWSFLRKYLTFKSWQVACFFVTYLAASFGGELWYVGWWTPFGYLLFCLWLQVAFERSPKKYWIVALCALWICWQSIGIAKAIACVPTLRRDIDKFFAEIQTTLPQSSTVLLHSVPDPFPILQRNRPDLTMIQISPTPMPLKAFALVNKNADLFVGLTEWGEGRGLKLLEVQKEWHFQTILGIWYVRVQKPEKGSAIKSKNR